MINKLIIDGVNTELSEKTVMPYTYTFSQAKTHEVKIALDDTNEICAEAFKDCPRLTKISFPEEITMIKRRAFENCTGLKSIVIPSTIKYIGANVFEGCTNLSEVDFEATTPPDVYCDFPDKCTCFIPDDSKYLEADKSNIDVDNTIYYTKTFYGKYQQVNDPSKINESSEGTYYYDAWTSVAKNDVTVEYKNRVPIDAITFPELGDTASTPVQAVQANGQATISYIFEPSNETNHHITWVSGNEDLVKIYDTSQEGKTVVSIANTNAGEIGSCRLVAYAESGVWGAVRLQISGGTLNNAGTDSGGGSSYEGGDSDDSGDSGDSTEKILVKSITASDMTVKVGAAVNINYAILPEDATNQTVTFSAVGDNVTGVDFSDSSVGTVSAAGVYTIKITANDGSNVSKTITLTVTE